MQAKYRIALGILVICALVGAVFAGIEIGKGLDIGQKNVTSAVDEVGRSVAEGMESGVAEKRRDEDPTAPPQDPTADPSAPVLVPPPAPAPIIDPEPIPVPEPQPTPAPTAEPAATKPPIKPTPRWGHRRWAEQPIRVVDYGASQSKHPRKWRRIVRDALHQWEQSGVVRFRLKFADGPRCKGYSRKTLSESRRQYPDGQISVCKLVAGDPMIAGWTVAPSRNGSIREAVVALRAPQTACHEVGHALGLNHPADDPDSCLDYGDWRYPSPADFASLVGIYG